MNRQKQLKHLPGVDHLLDAIAKETGVGAFPRKVLLDAIRTTLARLRTDIMADRSPDTGDKAILDAAARLAGRDWAELISPTHSEMTGSISTFLLHGFGETDVQEALLERYRITAAASGGQSPARIRVSTHIYNTFAQVDRLVEALEELHREGT